MDMVFKVNGVNMLPYVAYGGFKWQRNDIDGPDAGRDLTGRLRRNRVATKVKLDITCRPLKSSEAATVLSAIKPEYVTVEYYDPEAGAVLKKTMYANNNPAVFQVRNGDGTTWWSGITFPLVEQ